MNSFIVFPGHLSTMSIKEGFYKIAGKIDRVTLHEQIYFYTFTFFSSPKSRFHLELLNYTIQYMLILLQIFIYINKSYDRIP